MLSQYIKKIEREIGLALFDRASGDIRITDAGRVCIDTGRKILDFKHQMEKAFNDFASYKTGSLIIGVTPYRAASMMPVITQQLQSLHPGMYLVVSEGMARMKTISSIESDLVKVTANFDKVHKRVDSLTEKVLDLKKMKHEYESRQIVDAYKKSGKTLEELLTFLNVEQAVDAGENSLVRNP